MCVVFFQKKTKLINEFVFFVMKSLRYLSGLTAAASPSLTKADLARIPLDVHDDIRRHLNKSQQISLWDGGFKRWWCRDEEALLECCSFKTLPNGLTLLHGEYNRWYINGQLWLDCRYKNGQLDGEYKELHFNGRVHMHCWYRDGQLNGEYRNWTEYGQLRLHRWYKDGRCVKRAAQDL